MPTPQVSTTARSLHRPSPSHPTTYERLLAGALAGAVAAVAAVALAVPSVSSPPDQGAGPVTAPGQLARGKATVPVLTASDRVPDDTAQL